MRFAVFVYRMKDVLDVTLAITTHDLHYLKLIEILILCKMQLDHIILHHRKPLNTYFYVTAQAPFQVDLILF